MDSLTGSPHVGATYRATGSRTCSPCYLRPSWPDHARTNPSDTTQPSPRSDREPRRARTDGRRPLRPRSAETRQRAPEVARNRGDMKAKQKRLTSASRTGQKVVRTHDATHGTGTAATASSATHCVSGVR